MNLLELKGVQIAAGDKIIVKNVSLTVKSGETHIIMGPNGSGKSTLVSTVMGQPAYAVTGGSMLFEGEDITGLSPDARAKRGIFMSFQTPEEVQGVTLENFLRTAVQAVTGKPAGIITFRRKLEKTMELLNMDNSYLSRYLNVAFSGGEKKKSEILQLLTLNPKLAMLDETDSGLDVDAVRTVAEGIKHYKTADNALIIITHNAKLLESLPADRVHIIAAGELKATGGRELIDQVNREGFAPFLNR